MSPAIAGDVDESSFASDFFLFQSQSPTQHSPTQIGEIDMDVRCKAVKFYSN